jgi:type IV pilus assembly protein PilW
LIVRDLRRAYWWGAPENSVWRSGATQTRANPYAASSPATSVAAADNFMYVISGANKNVADDNVVDVSAEQYGFRLNNDAIEMQRGGSGWQAMTDANTMKITVLSIAVNASTVPIACFACDAASTTCPPQQVVRQINLLITGQAVHDPNVIRSIGSTVRLRNDLVQGTCP